MTARHEGLDATKIDYGTALYLLKVFYGKAIQMIDAVARGGYLNMENATLNHYYLSTLSVIDEILKRADFEEFGGGANSLFPSLVGNEEIDTEWELGRKEAYAFLSRVEKRWFKSGKPTFQIPRELQEKFDAIDKAMEDFRNHSQKANSILVRTAKELKDERALRLIERDGKGDYSYNGTRIEMGKETIYYQVFDALFSHADQQGFTSYERIENHLVECGREPIDEDGKRDKRILNALSDGQGLFRYAVVNGTPLKNRTLDGKLLIDIVRGKGLRLNNSKL